MLSEQEVRLVDIEIKLDPEYKLPKVIVLTDKVTDEVNAIVSRLSGEVPKVIAGFVCVGCLTSIIQNRAFAFYSN